MIHIYDGKKDHYLPIRFSAPVLWHRKLRNGLQNRYTVRRDKPHFRKTILQIVFFCRNGLQNRYAVRRRKTILQIVSSPKNYDISSMRISYLSALSTEH